MKNINLVDWAKENKFKLAMTWIVLLTLISFFMLSLTFNFIGNDISTANLIFGFTFSTIGALVGATSGFLLFKTRKFDLLNIYLIVALTILFLFGTIFGSIGYLDVA